MTRVADFAAVDDAGSAGFFIRFLEMAKALPDLRAAKRVMLDDLALRSGDAALDIGCGLGSDVLG